MRWPYRVVNTGATAQIFTGSEPTNGPFERAVTISNQFEDDAENGGSGLDVEFNITTADSVPGDYHIHLRVNFANGKQQTFKNFAFIRVAPL